MCRLPRRACSCRVRVAPSPTTTTTHHHLARGMCGEVRMHSSSLLSTPHRYLPKIPSIRMLRPIDTYRRSDRYQRRRSNRYQRRRSNRCECGIRSRRMRNAIETNQRVGRRTAHRTRRKSASQQVLLQLSAVEAERSSWDTRGRKTRERKVRRTERIHGNHARRTRNEDPSPKRSLQEIRERGGKCTRETMRTDEADVWNNERSKRT